MTKLKKAARNHPFRAAFGVMFLVGLGFVGVIAVSLWRSFAPVNVDFSVPAAPRLYATNTGQTVYRVDASQSKVTYEIEQTPAGFSRLTVIHDLAGAPTMAQAVKSRFNQQGGGGWNWILSDLKSLIETGKIMSAA